MNANLFAALRSAFPAELDRTAVEAADGERLTYSWRDLDRASAMLANLLLSLNLAPASRVLVQTDKSIEALLLYLAVLRAGLIYVPLNIAYGPDEMSYFIGNAEPAVVVCAPRHFSWMARIAFQAGVQHVFTLGDDRTGSLLERAAVQSDRHEPVTCSADDVAVIIYTSGTTGRSKGAMLTHRNLLANAQVLKTYWDWQRDDVLIHALPIFHVHGLFVAIHGALLNGTPMLWFNRFEPRAVIERLPDATVFMGVPTLYVRLLAQTSLTREVCQRMRVFISGSAPLLTDTFEAFRNRTGHTIVERYGMSETLMLTSNPYRLQDGLRRAGTVGKPLPGVRVRLRDDAGQVVDGDAVGGVEVTGPSVFAGYWRMTEKTRDEFAVDAHGTRWFKTGDVGRIDEDGMLVLVGRSKDVVISGGFNVYPAEIESVINDIASVAESAVIGVPHADFGEAVVALIVPREGQTIDTDTVAQTLRNKLANFKQPKRLIVVDELPRNAMGKVQKQLLRERHHALFEAAV